MLGMLECPIDFPAATTLQEGGGGGEKTKIAKTEKTSLISTVSQLFLHGIVDVKRLCLMCEHCPPQHKGSRPLLSQDSDEKDDEEEIGDTEPEVKVHKYVIQAQVMRDSWPLSKSAWEFIAMLKNLDRLDLEGKSPLCFVFRTKQGSESKQRCDKAEKMATAKFLNQRNEPSQERAGQN